jgi:hypothetical protein
MFYEVIQMFSKLWATVKHYAVHAFGLALSLTAIYQTMITFSDIPLIRQFFGIGGVYAGLSIQHLRGRAAAYRKRNAPGDADKASSLWAIVIACILLFDFLSSFNILTAKVDAGDQQYTAIIEQRNSIKEDIDDIKADLRTKKEEQKAEFANKGRGKRYDTYQVEITNLEAELDQRKADLAALNTKAAIAKKSMFARLSEKTGIPAAWFEFAMFFGMMFLIYFVPLLTPWQVELERVSGGTGNTVTPKSVTQVRHVTAVKRNTVTGVTGTCICGEPTKPGSKYCGNPTCRVRASRAAKRLAEAGGGV